jgi:hypothetical protein
MTFQKGQSGNPGGRARERAFANAIRAEVAKVDPKIGRQRLLEIARKTVEMAISGDMSAIKEIGDRLDGKAMQQSIVSVEKHVATDWTTAELEAWLLEEGGCSPRVTRAANILRHSRRLCD